MQAVRPWGSEATGFNAVSSEQAAHCDPLVDALDSKPALPPAPDQSDTLTVTLKTFTDEHTKNMSNSFSAPIILNGIQVGKLTAQKIEIAAKSIIGCDGGEVQVTKDSSSDGFTLTLPRKPCANVNITLSEQGCRARADDQVFFTYVNDIKLAEESLAAKVQVINARWQQRVAVDDNE
ncbi:uncharacterized protein PV09_07316 [Verruconis gallopava]|uniref:Uncharacterized protein n=1 Tax=Verruconis gallopava TaxID=253628 RepID=A0A0D1YK76_9PEZI|nr:uncharacterized protein PV09_07316 [Verruconis gallopava]KIW01277.1 hypothetical protein PV09_07316 [Verruconis gallopava]